MTFLIALILIIALPNIAWAGLIWDSFSDEARTIQSDMFSEYGGLSYMKATGLPQASKTYKAKYYDADGALLQVETGISSNGEFLSQIIPAGFPESQPGTWTVELYRTEPKEQIIATDTFTVVESAIPEFPAVAAGISVAALCGSVYILMRRRGEYCNL